jgi:hypothetical protein
MNGGHFLRRYNQIALAVFLTWSVIFLGVATFSWWRSSQEYDDDVSWEEPNTSSVTGKEFETSQGTITAYMSESPDNPEALLDVRYVAMSTGKVTAMTDDNKALIFCEKGVGELGRVALVQTGKRDSRPIFDMIFISFPDLNRHVIARSVDALDTVQQLDDSKFSAIIWDDHEKGRFVIIDAQTGSIQSTRSLDFSRSRRTSGEEASPEAATAAAEDAARAAVEAAPENKFR